MLVGWGGNNGSTFTGALIANKDQITWMRKGNGRLRFSEIERWNSTCFRARFMYGEGLGGKKKLGQNLQLPIVEYFT
jgi:hypothetical protein